MDQFNQAQAYLVQQPFHLLSYIPGMGCNAHSAKERHDQLSAALMQECYIAPYLEKTTRLASVAESSGLLIWKDAIEHTTAAPGSAVVNHIHVGCRGNPLRKLEVAVQCWRGGE